MSNHQIRSLSHRRRSWGDSWDPSQPTADGGLTPAHWFKADAGLWQDAGVTPAAADGDPVGRWDDQTDNADHVSQGTAANKPTRQTVAGIGTVVRFDGTNDRLVGAFTTGGAISQPFTIFAVAALDSAVINDGIARVLLDDSDAANRVIIYKYEVANPDAWATYAGALLQGNDANSDWNIWTCLFNGGSSQFWHNGVSEASGNTAANDLDGLTVGDRQATGREWKGDMAEILIYSANPSATDINQINGYLSDRFGLPCTST